MLIRCIASLAFLSSSRAFRTMSSSTFRSVTSRAAVDKPFGAWESPITSKSITAGSVKIGGVNVCNDNLFWLEGRPQEAGRNVLCRYDTDSDQKSERNGVDVTPKDSNVRTKVHEYGGGALTMGDTKGEIFYSEFATQRLCKLVNGEEPHPITPDGDRFRFADGVLDDSTQQIFCVREDHEKPVPKDVVNEIVALTTDGSMSMHVLATGNDFYSAPRLSPDGKKLAYVTWNHPNMPWDATELRVASSSTGEDASSAKSSDHELIAGSDGDTSIIQPLWHPKTGDLYYISDESGFYNIYRAGYAKSILPMESDFGGAAPGWSLGQQGFGFLPDGRIIAQYKKDASSVLVVADVSADGPATGIQEYGIEDGLPMQFGGVVSTESNDLYFIGGSPSTPTSVYKWNLEKKGPAEILMCSSTLSFSEDIISVPKQIEFPTTLGTAYGYYYAPANGSFKCTTESAPPLLVKAHGGPTACTGTTFNAGIQFWTSRGFAVLDVDYGGSTGKRIRARSVVVCLLAFHASATRLLFSHNRLRSRLPQTSERFLGNC
jgi:dipeptidyl aminopeptidase/acylaminoacyl peptidase